MSEKKRTTAQRVRELEERVATITEVVAFMSAALQSLLEKREQDQDRLIKVVR